MDVRENTCLRIWKMFLLCFFFYFNCYLAAPQSIIGHYWGDSLTHPILVTAFSHFWPKGHREPRNEVESINSAARQVGFEPGAFRFWLRRLNSLGHPVGSECTLWCTLWLSGNCCFSLIPLILNNVFWNFLFN